VIDGLRFEVIDLVILIHSTALRTMGPEGSRPAVPSSTPGTDSSPDLTRFITPPVPFPLSKGCIDRNQG
jgi:hypothetical protein